MDEHDCEVCPCSTPGVTHCPCLHRQSPIPDEHYDPDWRDPIVRPIPPGVGP